MKKILFLLLTVSTIFLISCDDDTTEDKKTCDPACEIWETCDDGNCKLTDEMCNDNADCLNNAEGKTECSTEHKCELPSVDCTPDFKRCNNDNIETCSKDGDSWSVETCTAPAVCNDSSFTCEAPEVVSCTAGEKRCNENNVETCNASGDGWDIETCTTPKVCTVTSYTCEEINQSDCVGLSFDNIVLEDSDLEYGFSTYIETLSDYSYSLYIGFFNNPATLGTYDLGSGINTNYSTCDQCVLVYEIGDNKDKIFFQESGQIEIFKGNTALGESKGEVLSAKLIEVEIDDVEFSSTPVVDGGCIEIETGKTWAWDNTCTEGEQKCDENNNIATCNANGGWDITNCIDNSKTCTDTNGVFTCEELTGVICEPNKMGCNDDNVSKCNTEGTAWLLVTDCVADAKTCNPDTIVCETSIICPEDDDIGNAPSTATLVSLTDNVPYVRESNEAYACKDTDDWYKFELAENDVIDIVVNFMHDDGDIDLLLHRGAPEVVGDVDDPSVVGQSTQSGDGVNSEVINNTIYADQAGTYYLQLLTGDITETQKGNKYQIIITKNPL